MFKVYGGKREFDSSELLREKWKELVREEQRNTNIRFDLENDDTVGGIRWKKFFADTRGYGNDKDTYDVQLCTAGGDWESPTYYFRIQVKDGYPTGEMFVFIRSKIQGNGLLTKSDNGYVPMSADDYNKDGRDKKECWNAVIKFLEKRSKSAE